MTVAIGPYLQVRFAHLAGRLPSGELAYRSNISGTAQLWRIAPDGIHDQLTFGDERIAAATPSPQDDLFVVATDVGGDERFALVRVDGRTGAPAPLTDDPGAVHLPGASRRTAGATPSPTPSATAPTSTWPASALMAPGAGSSPSRGVTTRCSTGATPASSS